MKPTFETKFFEKKKFDKITIEKYFNNGIRNIRIAAENKNEEVIFKFSYDALIKIGIAIIAFSGFKIKSRQGHHIKIIEKLSQILNNEDIIITGEAMRKKRNSDLYLGGVFITEKEAKSYLEFVKDIKKESEEYLKSQKSLFEKL